MLIPTLLQAVSPIAKSVFIVCIWLVLLRLLGSLWNDFQQGRAHLQRLHQIPCGGCAFFTGEYHLKCTLHPSNALTESAINCLDYESAILRNRDYANGAAK